MAQTFKAFELPDDPDARPHGSSRINEKTPL
jgi:hypothetical protein